MQLTEIHKEVGKYHKTSKDIATRVSKVLIGKQDKQLIKLIETVMLDYLTRVTESIMDGQTYKIPMRLGYLFISKSRTTKKGIDWVNSKRLKKTIYLNNYHSDGFTYKWTWSKNNSYAIFTNKTLYSFTPPRPAKRALAQILKTEYRHYPTWNLFHSKQP